MGSFKSGVVFTAVALVGAAAAPSHAAQVFYEGFNYTPGTALNLQNNTSVSGGDTWTRSGTVAAANITVQSGSLTSPAGPSTGGKAQILNPATASTERLNFAAISSGTVFTSFTLNANVGAATVNNVAGAYFMGLSSLDDNGDVDGNAAPANTNIAGRMALRLDPGDATKLNIALSNTAAQTSTSYAATMLSQNTDIFIIMSYEIVAGANNDIAKLYINPNTASFDPLTTPADLTVTGQQDVVDVKSLFLRQTGGLPETVLVDEIRVGTSYVDVVPEPATLGIASLAALGLLARRRRA
jgi:hypothetical protein